jgi:UDP-N-acetylglucosamine 4,6-dehydratase
MTQKSFFKNKAILITGGTGSLGKELTTYFLRNKYPLKKIIIFSRDELKQSEMKNFFLNKDPRGLLRFFLGDIRDKERLDFAFEKVDIVIHAAALKHVDASEYNPIEFIKTNIMGAQNVIECSIKNEVQNVIALSTDKASSPINLYGATKLCSDKLFINSNNIRGNKKIKFSVVRYGNVMGSRGSVLHSFLNQSKNGELLITDNSMTRFHILLEDAISMIIWSLINSIGGEIFVPKIPSFKIKDLAQAICEDCKIKITGFRPGEKLHEEMISIYDSKNTIDLKKYYAIVPDSLIKIYKDKNYKLVDKNFFYNSGSNKSFLDVIDLKRILKNITKDS